MPMVLRNFFAWIYLLLASHKETEEDRRRAKEREERKDRLFLLKEEKKHTNERILAHYNAQKPTIEEFDEEENSCQIKLERKWAKKAIKINYEPTRIHGIVGKPRFYEAEIVPPGAFTKLKTYVYAYVECRDCKNGSTVFVYVPEMLNEPKKYLAYTFHNETYTPLTDSDTIELAARLFDGIF